MNKIMKQILPLLMFVLLMGSCNDTPEYYTLETPTDQMKIKASADNVILLKSDEMKDAITFNWNKAADRGFGTEVVYYFRLYHADMKVLKSELIKLDSETHSITWTVRQLNNILDAWKITPGDEVVIEAEVLAVVETSAEYMKPELSMTKFNVVGYDSSNKLFLTIEENSQKRILEMEIIDESTFKWKGVLDICDFWFVRNRDKGVPAYTKGADEKSLVYSDSGQGDRFKVEKLGNYEITVDLNTMEMTLSAPINRLFMVTSIGGVEKITMLNEAEMGSDAFFLQERFDAGTKFRFVRDEEVLWPAYVKGANSTKIELKEAGAEMFSISKTADYVMTVNMVDLSLILIEVYKSPTGVIAVVGDAIVGNAWDAGAAISNFKLTQKDLINKPEIVSYTGQFEYRASGSENSFKFVGAPDWGHTIFATKPNANPFDQNDQNTTLINNGDWKWTLPAGTELGIYTLELNLNTMKIKLIKN